MSANTETTGAVKVGDVFERLINIDSHRRAGSQFTIEEVDDEYAHWERRLYCLRPEHLLDSTRYRRIVTPPIAAPAAHVERRKGQRWKSVRRFPYGELIVTGTLGDRMRDDDGWSLVDVERSDGIGAFSSCFTDCCWTRADDAMTLLADAPPEPAKSTVTSYGGGTLWSCHSCGYAQVVGTPCNCPPAQEAPKAAPALEWSFTDKEGRDHWFATGIERDAASRAYWSWMKEQTGKTYAGHERLPKPQLAADWVEDCLPEAGR